MTRQHLRSIRLSRTELNVLFIARHITVLAFVLTSYIGRVHVPTWEYLVDLLFVTAFGTWAHRRSLRTGTVPSVLPLIDAATCVAWMQLQPETGGQYMIALIGALTLSSLAVDLRFVWSSAFLAIAAGLFIQMGASDTANRMSFIRNSVVVFGVLTAITMVRLAQSRQHHSALHQAGHDQLTGLANRALLATKLSSAITSVHTAFLLLDLDDFKEINDSLGHGTGDRVLCEVANRLRNAVKDPCIVGRLGGDEFAVIAPGYRRDEATALADRISKAITRPMDIDAFHLDVKGSIGIALSPAHSADIAELQRQADVAMYDAKQSGRDFRFFDPATDRIRVKRVALISDLRDAIEEGQFELWYQPVMGLHRMKLIAVESLIRWRHPSRGLLMPSEFINVAETSGVANPLTRWVIARAVQDAHQLGDQGYFLSVSCNLSAANFYDDQLPSYIGELFEHFGHPPSGMWLEITETQLIEDPSRAQRMLTQLADMGIATAVDDFGTGYSSLALLQQIRTGGLKIDRSFTAAMREDPHAHALVSSVIELGHRLGMLVVAEGVEDQFTLDQLRELGCDGAQGYHIGRPMPLEHLLRFLERHDAQHRPLRSIDAWEHQGT